MTTEDEFVSWMAKRLYEYHGAKNYTEANKLANRYFGELTFDGQGGGNRFFYPNMTIVAAYEWADKGNQLDIWRAEDELND